MAVNSDVAIFPPTHLGRGLFFRHRDNKNKEEPQ